MALSNSQKELLNLIRDVSTEKSQGERKIVNLKREIQQLQSELDSVNLELEEAKRLKECTEQELKGYEVELAMSESSIQALEGRISLIQDEISAVGSDLEALKNEERALRDDFIGKMFDLNAKIRKFQQSVDSATIEAFNSDTNSQNVDMVYANTKETEEAKRDLEDKLAQIISETNIEEDKFQSEQILYMQEKKELEDLNHRISLMEAVMKASKELHQLTIKTSKLEEAYASFGEKLQEKCICPSCHCDNAEMLSGIL
ncbi:uncharacterized protein LOC111902162 [Lactuca sativa]|uniref:uncharacterized protein LOC111902162 n=1 Tax=Lactuca sativa TaxID=4236 RepID=UPI001C689B3A|nr:uncharacterized protein LOC111902162 [Lactuca sativa]